MYRKIVYPTDFSDYSNKVKECVINLKPAGVEEVILLHVIDKRLFAQFPEVSQDVITAMRESAEENIKDVEKELKDAGLKVDTRIEMGVPFHQIIGIAKAEAASMIVIGSHGRSLVEEMLLGSTTENVLRHSTVPVLIEKFQVKKEEDKLIFKPRTINPFEKILFPTDFSDCANEVIPYLKRLKDAGTKEIIVTHIQDMTRLAPHLLDKLPEFEDIDTGRLADIKKELEGSGIKKVKTVLKEGVPFDEIDQISNQEDVGMIAVGSHGKSMIKEMILGSVSGKIVRRSMRPILVIKKK